MNKNSKCKVESCVNACQAENRKGICEPPLFVLATYRHKFRLFSTRLEEQFKDLPKCLDDSNEYFTSGAFSKDSSYWIMGTSTGRVVSYKTTDGEQEKSPS